MTRTSPPQRKVSATLRIDVVGERDESDPYRHKWVTRVSLGELTGAGRNTAEALAELEAEVRSLVSCPEALEALAKARARHTALREAAAAQPSTKPTFAQDEAVEVLIETPKGAAWVPGEYDAPEGSVHSVWVPSIHGWTVVDDARVRAVNRPSLADVG